MARLTLAKRAALPKREFAGGGPKGKEESIKAKARRKLGSSETTHPQSHAAFEALGRKKY